MRCLLDTDVLSEVIKRKNPLILQRANAYLVRYRWLTFSSITRYEVLRGLKAKNATAKLARFAAFCRREIILPLNEDIIDIAADIWVTLRRAGQPIGELDYLIAATALHHGLAVATRNVAHFGRVPGLTVEDWSQP